MFMLPALQDILKIGAKDIDFYQCELGAPRGKPTRIRYKGLQLDFPPECSHEKQW